jgi:hypothetical protein
MSIKNETFMHNPRRKKQASPSWCLLILTTSLLFAGCASVPTTGEWNGKTYPVVTQNGRRVIQIPAEDYLEQQLVETPAPPSASGKCILVDTQVQRAWEYNNGELVLSSVTCTGKPGFETPHGRFKVVSKHKEWVSTIYHVPMPYFLRLNAGNKGSVGLHAGIIEINPSSHGCIRLPRNKAEEFFNNTPVGTLVIVQ